MKEFNLEEAKNGAPICTRNGLKAKIIYYDLKHEHYPIVAVVTYNTEEVVHLYTKNGQFNFNGHLDSMDLMIASNKHIGWINIYSKLGLFLTGNNIYNTKDEAIAHHNDNYPLVTTIKIKWEK